MKIVNGQQVFSLDFTGAELAVLNEGLVQVPFGKVAGVIASINQQLQAQTQLPRTEVVSNNTSDDDTVIGMKV